MPEPTTSNIGLIVPNTGDLPGAWGTAALNPNFQAVDGILGGTLSLSFSSATTIALSTATGSITPSAGPFQSQNACLFFNGTLTGNVVIRFTQPGRYVVHNQCTVGGFYVQLAPSSGTGNAIGAPPGQKVGVFYDGTSMDYTDGLPVGAAFDLHGATAIPSWIASACTVPPYLLKDGSIYSTSAYPALGAMLGSTFGGNGITTFGVPDEMARVRVGIDMSNTGRLTAAISGVNGTTMGSAGGSQSMQTHTHGVTDPHHSHVISGGSNVLVNNVAGTIGGAGANLGQPTNISPTLSAPTGISIQASGTGTAQNVQPTIVSFLPLIRAA